MLYLLYLTFPFSMWFGVVWWFWWWWRWRKEAKKKWNKATESACLFCYSLSLSLLMCVLFTLVFITIDFRQISLQMKINNNEKNGHPDRIESSFSIINYIRYHHHHHHMSYVDLFSIVIKQTKLGKQKCKH